MICVQRHGVRCAEDRMARLPHLLGCCVCAVCGSVQLLPCPHAPCSCLASMETNEMPIGRYRMPQRRYKSFVLLTGTIRDSSPILAVPTTSALAVCRPDRPGLRHSQDAWAGGGGRTPGRSPGGQSAPRGPPGTTHGPASPHPERGQLAPPHRVQGLLRKPGQGGCRCSQLVDFGAYTNSQACKCSVRGAFCRLVRLGGHVRQYGGFCTSLFRPKQDSHARDAPAWPASSRGTEVHPTASSSECSNK